MAWTDLKAAVAAVIKTNGNQEITGALLQSTLNSIIDQVGANASYKGVAIPSTNPGTPDAPVFYIASTQGTYANFGGFVLDGGFAVLSNVSGSWTGTKFLKTEMDAKAAHGYSGTPKTLKEVEDALTSDLDLTNGKVDSLTDLINGSSKINYFIGQGLSDTSPKYIFKTAAESTGSPRVENIVDVDSPFKDLLGYVARISNTYSTNPTSSFLMATSDYLNIIPDTLDISFWTRNSDFDSILPGFAPKFGFYSYAPVILGTEIAFDWKNVLAGSTYSGTKNSGLLSCSWTVRKVFEQDGFSQIILSLTNINFLNGSTLLWRPMMQFSGLAPKWINKSFLMVNPQLLLNETANIGLKVYRDAENVVNIEYPETVDSKVAVVEQHVSEVESQVEEVALSLNDFRTQVEEGFNNVYFGPDAINQISGIGTSNPSVSFLKDQNEVPVASGYPKVENIVDFNSPFQGVLERLTRFTNTQTSQVSNFKFEATEVRSNVPESITLSFWVNKDQFDLIGFNLFRVDFWIGSYSHNPISIQSLPLYIKSRLSDDVGVKVTGSWNSTFMNSSYETYKAYEIGSWAQIILHVTGISFNVAPGTLWKYGWGFNSQQPYWTGLSLDFANFQIIENGSVPIGKFVIPDVGNTVSVYPSNLASYESRIEGVEQQVSDIQQEVEDFISNRPNKFIYNNAESGLSYIESDFNETKKIRVKFYAKRVYSESANPVFNFSSVSLVDKITGTETIVHSNGDDIAPPSFNSTYIGANHGCSDLRKVTVTGGHGKTFADIGSEWSNGTFKFYIVGIINSTTLSVLGENYQTYPIWQFRTVATGNTLTHLSGATNTASFVVANSEMIQFVPASKVSSLKVIADGVPLTDSGTYAFNELNICEEYDILNVASTLEAIKNGVGTFSSNPVYNDLGQDKVVRLSITYKFTNKGLCTVSTNFIAYQNLNISYFGFIQQGVLYGSDVNLYIPKALPIMDGSTEKDFRTIADHNTVTTTMNLTSAYWENPLLPPDRYIEFSENVGLFAGFLFDYGVGGPNRKDVVNNTFFLYTSRKVYPFGIDSKLTINAGDSYSAVCFRKYIDRNRINQNGIIAMNSFEYEGALYIYGDFNQIGYYEMDVEDGFIGKQIEVLEKSNNIKILSEIASSKILIKVETATPLYGYCVIKIK